jgi:hypothetical protein
MLLDKHSNVSFPQLCYVNDTSESQVICDLWQAGVVRPLAFFLRLGGQQVVPMVPGARFWLYL